MPDTVVVEASISKDTLKEIAQRRFGDMVKGVVDIDKGIMAVGGELHVDIEAWLLERGSQQNNLWGINIYPDLPMPEMLEFDSMINIRPRQNNTSRSVEDPVLREKITDVVTKLIAD